MTNKIAKALELSSAEIDTVTGANGVTAGPNGGCIPDLPWPPVLQPFPFPWDQQPTAE